MYQLDVMFKGKNKWVLIAKILNIISLIMSFFILIGGFIQFDWSRMPYDDTSRITFGGALFSLATFFFITLTLAFTYYVLRRVSKEMEQKNGDNSQEQ